MASLEFAVPPNRVLAGWWWLYTRAVLPVAGAALGGRAWFDVGRFLGPNITGHYRRFPVAATVAAWEAAGLADVGVRRMSLGGGLVMWGRRAGRPPRHRIGPAVRTNSPPTRLRPSTPRRRDRTRRAWADWWVAAPPALHAVAPLLRRHRRHARPPLRRRPPRRHPASPSSSPSGCAPTPSTSSTAARCAPPSPAGSSSPAAAASLAGAVALGVVGMARVGPGLAVFIVVGVVLTLRLQPRAVRRPPPQRRHVRRRLGRLPRPRRLLRPSRDAAPPRARGRVAAYALSRRAALAQHPGPHAAPPSGRGRRHRHLRRRPHRRRCPPRSLLAPLEAALKATACGWSRPRGRPRRLPHHLTAKSRMSEAALSLVTLTIPWTRRRRRSWVPPNRPACWRRARRRRAELLEMYLERIGRLDPQLNALPHRARGQGSP